MLSLEKEISDIWNGSPVTKWKREWALSDFNKKIPDNIAGDQFQAERHLQKLNKIEAIVQDRINEGLLSTAEYLREYSKLLFEKKKAEK